MLPCGTCKVLLEQSTDPPCRGKATWDILHKHYEGNDCEDGDDDDDDGGGIGLEGEVQVP